MPKPSDMLFGPSRSAVQREDKSWVVTVTPPAIVQLPASQICLSEDQYARFLEWIAGVKLIQEALPDLSPAQREILLTGIGDEDFKRITPEDEEE